MKTRNAELQTRVLELLQALKISREQSTHFQNVYSYWGSVVDAKKQKAAAAAKACVTLPDFFDTLTVEEEEEETHGDDDHHKDHDDCADIKGDNMKRQRVSSSASSSKLTNTTDSTTECSELVVVGSGVGISITGSIGGGDVFECASLNKAKSANMQNKSQQPWGKCS